jgi:hypothetical protein
VQIRVRRLQRGGPAYNNLWTTRDAHLLLSVSLLEIYSARQSIDIRFPFDCLTRLLACGRMRIGRTCRLARRLPFVCTQLGLSATSHSLAW